MFKNVERTTLADAWIDRSRSFGMRGCFGVWFIFSAARQVNSELNPTDCSVNPNHCCLGMSCPQPNSTQPDQMQPTQFRRVASNKGVGVLAEAGEAALLIVAKSVQLANIGLHNSNINGSTCATQPPDVTWLSFARHCLGGTCNMQERMAYFHVLVLLLLVIYQAYDGCDWSPIQILFCLHNIAALFHALEWAHYIKGLRRWWNSKTGIASICAGIWKDCQTQSRENFSYNLVPRHVSWEILSFSFLASHFCTLNLQASFDSSN